MPRRILHIIPTLDRSGAEKQLTLLAAGLPRDEFDVHVCALTRGGPLLKSLGVAGIPTTVIGKRWKLDPSAWWRLRRHVAALRPDLVQTWLFAANAYGRAVAISTGVPRIVASERSVDPWKRGHELALDRRLARRTDRIVVNSTGVSDFYIGHGLPREKFVLIPNGIDPREASSNRLPFSRDALLAEWELSADARLVIAVGRLWPQKRVDDLIAALGILKMFRHDIHLLIVGDGPLRQRLERFRDDLELHECVHFLGHRADVPQLLPLCDLMCLASGYEGLPNVVMEAMLAGLPVLASDIPGNRDLITSGHTGQLVPLGDRPALARWINKLLDERDLASRLAGAASERVRTEFTVERMVARHATLYRELLD